MSVEVVVICDRTVDVGKICGKKRSGASWQSACGDGWYVNPYSLIAVCPAHRMDATTKGK